MGTLGRQAAGQHSRDPSADLDPIMRIICIFTSALLLLPHPSHDDIFWSSRWPAVRNGFVTCQGSLGIDPPIQQCPFPALFRSSRFRLRGLPVQAVFQLSPTWHGKHAGGASELLGETTSTAEHENPRSGIVAGGLAAGYWAVARHICSTALAGHAVDLSPAGGALAIRVAVAEDGISKLSGVRFSTPRLGCGVTVC